MSTCVRSGCSGVALAPWWALCAGCTTPLLDPVTDAPASGTSSGSTPPTGSVAVTDQRVAAGWDAVTWAERIAPRRWGSAVDGDPWLTSVRCLVLASVVTGRADGCDHTRTSGATPVVAVARATGSLRCPSCAEPVVAAVTTDGHACDRCGRVPVGPGDRTAAVTGAALVLVAQLCDGCAGAVLALGVGPG